MNTSKEMTKFYVLASTLVVSVNRPKTLAPVVEMVFEVEVRQRRHLESDSALHAYLMHRITEDATEHFIVQLKADKTLARAIGGIQWRVSLRDQEFKLFLTRALAEEHMNSAERPAGPHDRFDFMREMILENFDDNADSVLPSTYSRAAAGSSQDQAVHGNGQR